VIFLAFRVLRNNYTRKMIGRNERSSEPAKGLGTKSREDFPFVFEVEGPSGLRGNTDPSCSDRPWRRK